MKQIARAAFAVIMITWLTAVRASTNSSEITDMWWNPAESGWGVNVILQNDVAFLTFFVYDTSQTPIWYTSAVQYQGANGAGALVWTGNLYATRGPWFGGAFPPANVVVRQAGTATFTVSNLNQATLTYSVDGVPVTKALQRQTWTMENYSGNYAGGYSIRLTGCNPAYLNGVQEVAGIVTVNQNGASISMSAASSIGSCSFSGTYAQTGKLGQAQGSYSCSDGTIGTFSLVEMTPTISGFTARASGQNQYCQWTGYFGGITRAQ